MSNTVNAADNADPDGDGIANIMERFFGLNPLAADVPSAMPAGVMQGNNFTMTYTRSLLATDLNYHVQWSSDLFAPG